MCKKDDPELDNCLKQVFESLRPKLSEGKQVFVYFTERRHTNAFVYRKGTSTRDRYQ